MKEKYTQVTNESGRDFIMRNIQGEFTMLNLLRFRDIADYAESPHLEPEKEISGKEAYDLYIRETLPFFKESGSSVLFQGQGGSFVIGPKNEKWDFVLLVRHSSVEKFLAFANNQEYLKIAGHRTAALVDCRLLAIED